MRIPFPERIPMQYAATFAALLYVVQQIQGTDAYYSVCVMLFILIATFAFNTAGGFTRPSGGYVFFYAMLVAIIGWTTKALLGEAADSNLLQPNLTVSVYLASITGLAVAAAISRHFRPQQGWMSGMMTPEKLPIASAGCAVLGITVLLAANTIPHGDGSLLSALGQLGNLLELAIIFGVMHQILRSRGARSANLIVALSAFTIFTVNGLINFSKEGLFSPILSYLLAASAMRFRFSLRQVLVGFAFLFFVTTYLVPYSQYGRNFKSRDEDASVGRFLQNIAAAQALLADVDQVRLGYQDSTEALKERGEAAGYFNQDEALLDRLQMILPDDKLINATVEGKSQYGYFPLLAALLNSVPHALWPEKPDVDWGNLYAHEVGGLVADNDLTTGISFSPSAQAYHISGWTGVLVVAPIIWTLVFLFVDSLCGDTRTSPWGILFLVYFAHAAPELMLNGAIDAVCRYGPVLIVTAFLCSYGMPFLASIVMRKRPHLTAAVAPFPSQR